MKGSAKICGVVLGIMVSFLFLYLASYKLADRFLFDGAIRHAYHPKDPFGEIQHSRFWKIYSPLMRLDNKRVALLTEDLTEDLTGDWGDKDFHVRIQGKYLMMISNNTDYHVPETAKVRRTGALGDIQSDEVLVSSEDGEMIRLFAPFQSAVMNLPRFEP